MNEQRVVVTGIGLISPLALNAQEHFARLLAGHSAIERLDEEEYENYPSLAQARVRGFDRRESIPDRMLRKLLSAGSAYCLAGATAALVDSGVGAVEFADCGLYVGSVCLEVNPETFIPALRESVNRENEVDIDRFVRSGMKLIDPLFLVKSLPNAGLCAIAIQHQVLGPNANITNGAISGMQAVIAATEVIRRGDAAISLAGGYDCLLQMDCVVEHLLAGRLSRWKQSVAECCQPFGKNRDGYALGEGAAFLMLESMDHARGRGARAYGEVLSSGQSTCPRVFAGLNGHSVDALCVAAKQALSASGLAPADIDLILGDGLGVADHDDREVSAYRKIFADADVPFTAFTGAFGFVGAASGTFSLAHAFLSMHHGVIPPLTNCNDVIADFAMPFAHVAKRSPIEHALIWNSDRGIKSAAMVVGAR